MGMSPHEWAYFGLLATLQGGLKIKDPGTGKTIPIQKNFGVCPLTIAAAGETRSLPTASKVGVGTRVLVVADQITNNGYATISGVTLNAEGRWVEFKCIQSNGVNAWVVSPADSVGLMMSNAAVTYNAAANNTAGVSVYTETQDGGTAVAVSNGQDGGSYILTAGIGSAGKAGSDGNGGDSGSIALVTQAGGAKDGAGANGIDGAILLRPNGGRVFFKQAAPTAESATSQTYAAAELIGGLITSTQTSAVTGTLDTGANLDAAFPVAFLGTDVAFEWTLINLGSASGAVTVTASSGHTIVGSAAVAISTSASFITRRTAASTWVTYRK